MWEYKNTNELYHYGILGMKWGVRRYQNLDGSLTPAGEARYNKYDKQISDNNKQIEAYRKTFSDDIEKQLDNPNYKHSFSESMKLKIDAYRHNKLIRDNEKIRAKVQKWDDKFAKHVEKEFNYCQQLLSDMRSRYERAIIKELNKKKPNPKKLDRLGEGYAECGGYLPGHSTLKMLDNNTDATKNMFNTHAIETDKGIYEFWINPISFEYEGDPIYGWTKAKK